MPKIITIEKINEKRMQIKAKGYVTAAEAGTYCGVSNGRGREIYRLLEQNLIDEGIKVNACGISSKAFNDYLGITDSQIYDNYKLGY